MERKARTNSRQTSSLKSAFEHHQSTAVDALLRLLSEPLASVQTWLVIGIALALPLALILFLLNLQSLGSTLQEDSTVSVYLDSDVSDDAVAALLSSLEQREDIVSVELITPEAALAEFEAASGMGDVLQGLDDNPLPTVLQVVPGIGDAANVSRLQQELQQLAGVDEARIDLQWLQRLNAIVAFAARVAFLLALLLSLGVVMAIGNTVRLAIENRRAEIVVVKLVGGTDAWVARPFLYTGFWYGFGGGVAALFILFLSLLILQGPVANLLGAYESDYALSWLSPGFGLLVLTIAAALGWIGAWVSVLRHLRAIEPR